MGIKKKIKELYLKIAANLLSDSKFSRFGHYYLHLKNGVVPKPLNLNNPSSFNEKIIFLKLNNKFPDGHILADKYEVRDYIKNILGEEVLIDLIGVYDDASIINFDSLPEKFVMKATHGSGWNIIVKDRLEINIQETRKRLNNWLNEDYTRYGREWQYKNIKPRIIIEKFLENDKINPLYDFKFFCFNGEPKYIQVDLDRSTDHKRNFYDINWELQPFSLLYPNSNKEILPPANFDKMVHYARKVATDLKDRMEFVRIDFYDHNKRIYFGEITFHPEGGCGPFVPSIYDAILGRELKLRKKGS